MYKVTVPALLLVALSDCGPVVTASSGITSPDGQWVALVESKQWSGPGINHDATRVMLQQSGQPAFEILALSHQYTTIKIRVAWRDASHLLIRYGPNGRPCDHVEVNFQAIRAARIEITAEPLPENSHSVRC